MVEGCGPTAILTVDLHKLIGQPAFLEAERRDRDEPKARAEAETLACALFLVLGSSLVVYPAAEFPMVAKRNGAGLAIVNREPTEQDRLADLVLHEEIGPVMSCVVKPG